MDREILNGLVFSNYGEMEEGECCRVSMFLLRRWDSA